MDYIFHGVAKSQAQLSDFHFQVYMCINIYLTYNVILVSGVPNNDLPLVYIVKCSPQYVITICHHISYKNFSCD